MKRFIVTVLSIFLMAALFAPVMAQAQLAAPAGGILARIFSTTASRVALGAGGAISLISFMQNTVLAAQVQENGGYLPAYFEENYPDALTGTMYEDVVIYGSGSPRNKHDQAIKSYYTSGRKRQHRAENHRYTNDEYQFMQLSGAKRNPDLQ